jgi:hypothetical protein
VLAHPGRTLGLYLFVAATSLAFLLLYVWIAPDSRGSTTLAIAAGLSIGQAFLLARFYLRLALLAGETELYRSITAPGDGAAASTGR